MRINVYAEELTQETEIVEKVGANGVVHYGIRVYLQSPDTLHVTPNDDDRSAVTFWIPWTNDRGHDFSYVYEMFCNLVTSTVQASAAAPMPQ